MEHEKRAPLSVREVLVVEGRYDAARLANLVDGLILTTDGFHIFKDNEKREILRTLGRERGVVILTDSDAAGFRIRRYVADIVGSDHVRHAYVPAIAGKEPRKAAPGKEGLLGVEGIADDILRRALVAACTPAPPRTGQPVTHTDLFLLGLSGTEGSARRRRAFLDRAGLPPRLSTNAMVQVLNILYTREEVLAMAGQTRGADVPPGRQQAPCP